MTKRNFPLRPWERGIRGEGEIGNQKTEVRNQNVLYEHLLLISDVCVPTPDVPLTPASLPERGRGESLFVVAGAE
jgi:hypothetical protein